jgi:hypothetical protein
MKFMRTLLSFFVAFFREQKKPEALIWMIVAYREEVGI